MPAAASADEPSVAFGAFLNRSSLPSTSVSPSNPGGHTRLSTADILPVTQHGKVVPVTGRMRQGAPRLGGLGLGGIGITPNVEPQRSGPTSASTFASTPASGPAQLEVITPDQLPSHSPAPSRSSEKTPVLGVEAPSRPMSTRSLSSKLAPPPEPPKKSQGRLAKSVKSSEKLSTTSDHSPTSPQPPPSTMVTTELVDPSFRDSKNSSSVPAPIQRPFLSPELIKPAPRLGAFALDRPIPDAAPYTATQAPDPATSPETASDSLQEYMEPSPETRWSALRRDSNPPSTSTIVENGNSAMDPSQHLTDRSEGDNNQGENDDLVNISEPNVSGFQPESNIHLDSILDDSGNGDDLHISHTTVEAASEEENLVVSPVQIPLSPDSSSDSSFHSGEEDLDEELRPGPLDPPDTSSRSIREEHAEERPLEPEALDRPKEEQGTVEGPSLEGVIAGALVSGGLAVGYGAWRGLSAIANAGWGWSKANGGAPPSDPSASELETPSNAAPDASDAEEGRSDPSLEPNLSEEEPVENVELDVPAESASKEVLAPVDTQWGTLEFPMPEGLDLEQFKAIMESLGEEDVTASTQMEIDAQQAAYDAAFRLHSEASEPNSPTTEEPESVFLPPPPSLTRARLTPRQAGARSDDKDELHDIAAFVTSYDSDGASTIQEVDEAEANDIFPPDFSLSRTNDHRRSKDQRPTSRYFAPPGLSGGPSSPGRPSTSTRPRHSSAPPQSYSGSAVSVYSTDSTATVDSKKAKKGFFNVLGRKRTPSLRSEQSTNSPPPVDRRLRAASSDSSSSGSLPKLFRKTSAVRPVSSVVSDIRDATYVDYGSTKGGRRNSAISATSSNEPDSPQIGNVVDKDSRGTVKPILRHHSRYENGATSRSRRRSVRRSILHDANKTMYSVRFGNATQGLGLRSVAEDEATRAGGDSFGLKWIGTERGRYGNLTVITDEESDVMYAEQVQAIKKKWRAFGSQKDWAQVKID